MAHGAPSHAMPSAIRIRDVYKSYGALRALGGVSLEIEQGEIFGLLGPNGAGKTTLISVVAGLARADSGSVEVMGADVVADYRNARRLLGIFHEHLIEIAKAEKEDGVFRQFAADAPVLIHHGCSFSVRIHFNMLIIK